MTRDSYTVETSRWDLGLELHITGPNGFDGMSQTSFLEDAVNMARDYIANRLEIPADSFDVELRPVTLPPGGEKFDAELMRSTLYALACQAYCYWQARLSGQIDANISVDELRGAFTAHLMTAALFELTPESYAQGSVSEAAIRQKCGEIHDRIQAQYQN